MTPPKRNSDRRHWPENLQATTRKDGRLYYYYLRPDLPKGDPNRNETFGYCEEKDAIDAAKQLNQLFSPGGPMVQRVINRLSTGDNIPEVTLFCDYIKKFTTIILRNRLINGSKLSTQTLKEYDRLYRNIDTALGHRPFTSITQADYSAFLEEAGTTHEVYNKYRSRLTDLCKHAVSDGIIPENIPLKIVRKCQEKKKRPPLTLPGDHPSKPGLDPRAVYDAIYDQATPAIKNAMELALNFLQRRSEIQRWHRDWSYTNTDGKKIIYVIISKTHKHGSDSYIGISEDIPVVHSRKGANTLGELVALCLKGTLCPYLVQQKPKRGNRKSTEKKHLWQLSPKQISDGFAAARDASGLYDHLPKGEKPTFHKIINLGQLLRREQGWSDQQVSDLRGHSKISTTEIYFEGHNWKLIEAPKS